MKRILMIILIAIFNGIVYMGLKLLVKNYQNYVSWDRIEPILFFILSIFCISAYLVLTKQFK